jgi:hypothetical protein
MKGGPDLGMNWVLGCERGGGCGRSIESGTMVVDLVVDLCGHTKEGRRELC